MFDKKFFESILGERIRETCPPDPEHVPVVLLHLKDGAVLDLCHILNAEPAWVAVMHFRDTPTCEDTDCSFVLYGMINRITLSHRPRTEREVGFTQEDGAAKRD